MRNIPSFIPSVPYALYCLSSPLFFLFDGVTARAATAVTARLVILIKVNLAPTDSPLLLSMEREWQTCLPILLPFGASLLFHCSPSLPSLLV